MHVIVRRIVQKIKRAFSMPILDVIVNLSNGRQANSRFVIDPWLAGVHYLCVENS